MLLMRTHGFQNDFGKLMTNFLRPNRALRRYMRHRIVRRANVHVGGLGCFKDRP